MGVLVLRPGDHEGLLTVAEGAELMRKGFADFAHSPSVLSNPRTRTTTAQGFRMSVHQGVNPTVGGAFTSARVDLITMTDRQNYAGRGRPVYSLWDTNTAELLMIMIGEPRPRGYEHVKAIAGFHTSCVAAVGTNLVARPDARRVGVIGSGGQARLHLAALAATRTVSEAVVFSPRAPRREAYATEMTAALGIPVRPVDTVREAVRFAEILLVCTDSNEPVFDGRDLQPGTNITNIVHGNKEYRQVGLSKDLRRDVDDETLRRTELFVTTNRAQEELDQPEIPWGAVQRGVMQWDDIIELSDLMTGRCSPAAVHARGGVTFFKNAAGWGIGFGSLLRGLHDRARERGVGLELDNVAGLEPSYDR